MATLKTVGGVGSIMRLSVFAAAFTFLLWGTPAFAVDTDGDGFDDVIDNCDLKPNPGQDDTDADGCGNLCDADYDNVETVGFFDFLEFAGAFGTTDEEKCHFEPIPGCTVGFNDFLIFADLYGDPPGPC